MSTNVKYVAGSLQKLPHPPPTSVSSHCSCLREHTERQKVAGSGGSGEGGWEWHLGNARWPLQHVSFHASFIHFITSLGRCEGVEKKPCYTETEREGPHSIFSSPGAATATAGSPLAWVKSAAVNGGRVKVLCECTVAADGQRTWPRMKDRWVRKGAGRRNGRCIFLFTRFLSPLVETVVSAASSASLWGLCSAFGALNVICDIAIQLSFCAPQLYVNDCVIQRGDSMIFQPWSLTQNVHPVSL